jgi:hypothetical protein
MQLTHLDENGMVGNSVPLGASATGQTRLTGYDGGLLLGSFDGAATTLERRDTAGAPNGAAEAIAGLSLPAQDFTTLSTGEAAWAWTSGSTLQVARVQTCR